MIVMHERDAPALEVAEPFKRTLKVLLSPQLNSAVGPIAAGLTILAPGGMSDFARHTEGEMFYVVSGKGSMRVGDETLPITPGDAVWVPGETAHQMENTGQVVLKVLWVLSPPGREADILRQCELARLDPKGHE